MSEDTHENTYIQTMTNSHEYFMQQALREANTAGEGGEVPIGAVIVMNDRIISRGFNQVEKLNDCTAHAEIIVLTSAFNHLGAKYLPEATLYVTIEPCLMCAGALYWSKIKSIVYGARDGKNGYSKYITTAMLTDKVKNKDPDIKISHPPFHPKTELITGICEEECVLLIQDFFKKRR